MTSSPERVYDLSACAECGNDDPCEGFIYCSDCLEALQHDADVMP